VRQSLTVITGLVINFRNAPGRKEMDKIIKRKAKENYKRRAK
jgi:hypothetical protein